MRPTRLVSVAVLALAAASLPAQDKKPAADDGFVPLFNGRDLSGWVNVNCHPDTFVVKDGEIVTNGKPMGFLRTEKQYENFVLEMDWMHVNKTEVGNSGLFVWGDPLPVTGSVYTRGIEVQILVNLEYKDKKTGKVTASSHGDVFAIQGATCKPDRPHPTGGMRCIPSEFRAKGGGEWNHYKVTANNGVIKLEVNGKEVSGVSECTPRKGYLALESEGAECHFKNIKIKELPSTNPKPEETAKVAQGHTRLFNGLDLAGWTAEKDSWSVKGGKLVAKGAGSIGRGRAGRVVDGELIFDWKLPEKSNGKFLVGFGSLAMNTAADGTFSVSRLGDKAPSRIDEGKAKVKLGAWNRTVITDDDKALIITINGERVLNVPAAKKTIGSVNIQPTEGLEIMNVFYRSLREKK